MSILEFFLTAVAKFLFLEGRLDTGLGIWAGRFLQYLLISQNAKS